MILKFGDRNVEVKQLQLKLKAAGYDPGVLDGDFGKNTAAAVLAFQTERPDIEDDGIAGPMTLGALDAAILNVPLTQTKQSITANQCNADTWQRFTKFVQNITDRPVRYGPGRGLWHEGKFVITYGPGRLNADVTQWPNILDKPYPSFHCTSWCNFFLSWLCRRNHTYTHAGNIPAIWTLLLSSPELHSKPYPFRGFGDVAYRITPNGEGARRVTIPDIMDIREIYDRREELPTFMVFGQSTRKFGRWKWWHHTGVFAVRDGRLYRIAADGSRSSSGRYSAEPMRCTQITQTNITNFNNAIYRVYGVRTDDGTYGDSSQPYAEVTFE